MAKLAGITGDEWVLFEPFLQESNAPQKGAGFIVSTHHPEKLALFLLCHPRESGDLDSWLMYEEKNLDSRRSLSPQGDENDIFFQDGE